ncbi:hypothetical protein K1719_044243 [Acacia pycnantha]|nr:hypothetical protein K1719_044243 [Acacia pycnantha]
MDSSRKVSSDISSLLASSLLSSPSSSLRSPFKLVHKGWASSLSGRGGSPTLAAAQISRFSSREVPTFLIFLELHRKVFFRRRCHPGCELPSPSILPQIVRDFRINIVRWPGLKALLQQLSYFEAQ